ncbi:unnamed protein product, partial [Musa hybrid cultivar]
SPSSVSQWKKNAGRREDRISSLLAEEGRDNPSSCSRKRKEESRECDLPSAVDLAGLQQSPLYPKLAAAVVCLILLLCCFYPNLYEIFMTSLTLPNSRFPFSFFKKFSI